MFSQPISYSSFLALKQTPEDQGTWITNQKFFNFQIFRKNLPSFRGNKTETFRKLQRGTKVWAVKKNRMYRTLHIFLSGKSPNPTVGKCICDKIPLNTKICGRKDILFSFGCQDGDMCMLYLSLDMHMLHSGNCLGTKGRKSDESPQSQSCGVQNRTMN